MRAVDLFAGCGGLSLGLQRAGVDIQLALDAWEPAVKCYNENFDHEAELFDLEDEVAAIKRVCLIGPQLIVGGPPCQDFSQAGNRSEGSRANLTRSFSTIITSVLPEFFIMENVERARKSNAYGEARKAFSDAGYGLTEIVLNAAQCGVPQNRKRFFCIGHMGADDGFMESVLTKGLKKPLTVKQYLKDEIDIEAYYRHPRNYSRRAIYSVHEPAPTMRGVNRPVPGGYPGHPGDAIPLSKNIRPLTTRERSRIQTFPKRFKLNGTKTNIEQMIGNAVPVELAKYVGKCLLKYQKSGVVAESRLLYSKS